MNGYYNADIPHTRKTRHHPPCLTSLLSILEFSFSYWSLSSDYLTASVVEINYATIIRNFNSFSIVLISSIPSQALLALFFFLRYSSALFSTLSL